MRYLRQRKGIPLTLDMHVHGRSTLLGKADFLGIVLPVQKGLPLACFAILICHVQLSQRLQGCLESQATAEEADAAQLPHPVFHIVLFSSAGPTQAE